MNQVPVIDFTKCIKCKECISVCQENAILESSGTNCSRCIKYCLSLDVPCNPDQYIFVYERCNHCGLCIEKCTQSAIYLFNPVKKDYLF